MATLDVFTTERKKAGSVDVPAIIAESKPNDGLIFDAVHAVQINQRQGTVCTKTRGEVSGGGRKPFRQKGTGRARQGSIRAPIYVGGGTTFGPRQRQWRIELPKKQRRRALTLALADKIKNEQLVLVDAWNCDTPSTKALIAQLKTLEVNKALLVVESAQPALYKSARNIPGVDVIESQLVSTADIITHEHVVMTKAAFEKVAEERLG